MAQQLTYKKIFTFWIPLAATWLMMATEGPFLAAVIARMIEPKINLAAYGVSYSLAIIVEAPIIMIMSATTALYKNKDSFLKLRNFTYAANALITAFMLFLVIPPVFTFFAESIIGLPEDVAHLTHIATIVFLPWPAAIGYRRLYQGILIKNDKTKKVAYGTVVRLVTMALVAIILYFVNAFDGVVVGAAALSLGVVAEAIASKIMCSKIISTIKNKADALEGEEPLTYKGIYKFYYPLALTSIISLAVHPMVTFFMGHAKMSIESLAVLPVINSLVFVFRSFGLSFQEVAIALMGEKFEGYDKLKKFALVLGSFVLAILCLIAFTPLSRFYFGDLSGLSEALTEFAILPLQIMALMPALTVMINFQRGTLIYSKNTKPLSVATTIEVVGIILILFLTVEFFDFVGAVAAVIGFILGRFSALLYIFPFFLKTVKSKQNSI